ncbi:MAG: Gfo/Idh/MocA family oxidoreductase [Thermoguttaceae bacterium]|nr:Gfo/Idh/MocA family oxidoreductase [Thermoguttaceae bacterium]
MSVTSRREFLKTSAAIGAGYWVAAGVQGAESRSPNERIAMASIGVEGKGHSDSDDAGKHGDMVAICDVDVNRLNQAGEKRFPKAKRYTDFRKMLEEMRESIDAVTVSTADHTHAPASLMAMRMGKHCFCQKPLTRTIYEARLMGQVAREMKVATQMGNQGTASDGLRRGAALLRAGALGTVKEIHIWTNRPIWPQGQDRPQGEDPLPADLEWDLWLGPAPVRPFKAKYPEGSLAGKPVYHPFVWRGWWDFGSGALGDMGCHEINMVFMGLDLRNPATVQAVTSGHNRDSFPAWSIVTYQFAATANRPAVKLVWYDGGKKPSAEVLEGKETGASGSVIIGEDGKAIGGSRALGSDAKEVEFPKSPGHFEEWVRAIKGGEPAMSNFPDYAGPLAETVLLGNLAVWAAHEINAKQGDEPAAQGETIEWDAEKLQAKNVSGLEGLIKPAYRAGYTLDV